MVASAVPIVVNSDILGYKFIASLIRSVPVFATTRQWKLEFSITFPIHQPMILCGVYDTFFPGLSCVTSLVHDGANGIVLYSKYPNMLMNVEILGLSLNVCIMFKLIVAWYTRFY